MCLDHLLRASLVPCLHRPFSSANVGCSEGLGFDFDSLESADLIQAIFAYQTQNLKGHETGEKKKKG
jgi:hypothetical protein